MSTEADARQRELCGRGRKEEKSQREESAHSLSAAVIAEIL